jgi:hypothetical protein
MLSAEDVPLPDGMSVESLRQALRHAGAIFAFLHGSWVAGINRPDSDVDVAAWFDRPVDAWEVTLPSGCDLLVLDTAGLELAGRVAQQGVLLVDEHPPVRVAWQADHAKRYLDEVHRRRELVATVFDRG